MFYRIVTIFFSFILFTNCNFNGIRGNGKIVKEERNVSEFNKIDIAGKFDVQVDVGKQTKIIVIAEKNLLKYIKVKVKKNNLIIYTKGNIHPVKDMKIKIDTPNLNSVECSGANDLEIKHVNSEKFFIDLSGAGNIKIEGKTRKLFIDISGAADLVAKELLAENVRINISGAANAEIYSSKSLEADLSGVSSVKLYGNAKNIKKDISGVATFTKVKN